jgi:hypothetical protein
MSRAGWMMLVALVVCVVVVVAGWWFGRVAGMLDRPTTREREAAAPAERAGRERTERAPAVVVVDAAAFRPPAATVRDPAVRDEVRRRLLAAWAASLPDGFDAGAVDAAAFAAMPVLDGGTVDPTYLRERIREDFIPMARQCYEQLLARQPGASGRAVTEFVIAGDERVGGIVDEVRVEPGDGGLSDPGFGRCLEGSMSAVAFRPPPGRGTLRVRYPFTFAPDAPDASAR